MTMKGKPNTIEAVAQAAGVSTMTVSRVLRGTGNVSKQTAARVREAMDELGYVHNRLAGSLASARSAQIAVVIPSLQNIVFTELLAGITAGLSGVELQPLIGITEYSADRELQLVRSMLAWRPAGVILASMSHHDETVRMLKAAAVPVVEVMNLRQNPIDICVGIDHIQAGREMAGHLISKGHRQFGYLGSDHTLDLAAARRYAGFKDAIEQQGGRLLCSVIKPENSGIMLGRNHVSEVLSTAASQATPLDAIFFSNDAVATGAMLYCLAEGITVPDELALASFGGLEIAAAMPLPLTTLKSPRFEMGQLSAQRILTRLDGREVPSITNPGFELIPGQSS